MPHSRERHLSNILQKAAGFWPVLGLLGPRQAGKSTLLRDLLSLGKYISFDDEDTLADASSSAKNFLQKLPRPLIIDEAQKCPKIFDAVKFMVDREKIPGSYILSGSTQFSAKLGIRESLTGRIGLHYLYPMTLAEAAQHPFEPKRASPIHTLADRFPVEMMIARFHSGGLPVPLFTRDEALVRAYFQSWTDTTILRDAARAFKGRYDPDIAYSILSQMANASKNGDYAGLKHFKQTSRVVRNYLSAFEDIFLVHKLSPHDSTTGSHLWTFSDTGILAFFAGGVIGEGLQLSFARIAALNEILAVCEYSGHRLRPQYYKTARGAPIDLIWGTSLIKVSNQKPSQVDYDLRPLRAAMKKLNLNRGHLLWGLDREGEDNDKSFGKITIAPWTRYS